MTGDGTNDAPALAQADVGVAMNTGTQAAREAGNMVDLDSDPTKLIEVVEIGKQLLITRGSLTTFSIANDVAKYFAIIPAMFAGVLPALDRLNVMNLSSPRSAILSAVIFNALDHRRPRPARAARREVRRADIDGDPAAQPAHVRRRRPHRPVRLHQADRHRHHGPGSQVMRRQLMPAVVAILLFTALALVYGVVTTLAGQVFFKNKADGSLVKDAKGDVVGSRLIGQDFTKPQYFHPRPAADDYASGPDYSYGSNYGPTNAALIGNVPGVSIDGKTNPYATPSRPLLRPGAGDRQGRQPGHRQRRQPGVREEQGRHVRVRPEHGRRTSDGVPAGEPSRAGRAGAGRRGDGVRQRARSADHGRERQAPGTTRRSGSSHCRSRRCSRSSRTTPTRARSASSASRA